MCQPPLLIILYNTQIAVLWGCSFFYVCFKLSSYLYSTPYTPLDKRAMENTDEDTTTDDWSLEQPLAQTRTTAIVEVKGAINVVLTPLVAESLDR